MTVNTLGNHENERHERSSQTVGELLLRLLPIALSVFCLSALVYYHVRHGDLRANSTLQVLIAGIYDIFGLAPSVMCCLLVLTWSSIWFVTGRLERPWSRAGRLLAMTVMLGVFLNLGEGGVSPAPNKGQLGAWLAQHLVNTIYYLPSVILVVAVTIASLLLATEFFFSEYFERLRHRHEPATDGDAGVETAVTDHLRGLATPPGGPVHRTMPAAPAAPTISAALAAAAVEEIGDDPYAGEAEFDADAATAGATATREPVPEVSTGSRRRLSSFERRQLEQEEERARLAAASAEAEPADREVDALVSEPLAAAVVVDAAVEAGFAVGVADDADETDDLDESEDEAFDEADEADDFDAADDEEDEDEDEDEADEADEADEDTEEPVGAARWVSLVDGTSGVEAAAVEALAEVAEPAVAEPAVAEPAVDEAEAEFHEDEDEDVEPAMAEATEPVVAIPRPPARETRQQSLFAPGIDENLIQEASDVVTSAGRASANLLQRKLRIDYDLACDLLAALAKRGVVDLGADATHGRIVG